MLASGTRVVVRGLVDLERRVLVMTADQDDGILPEGYSADTVPDFSLAAEISGVDKKLHRISARIVEGFCNVEGSNNYTGSVVVEDDEIVAITLTISDVPDEEAHLLCKSAMIEATGVVTGDDFVMEMSCKWSTDVCIRTARRFEQSPSKSPSASPSSTLPADSRKESVGDKNLDQSSDSDGEPVHFLGSVDKEGQDQPVQNATARPIKQEDFAAYELYASSGQDVAGASDPLRETPKSRSSSAAEGQEQKERKRKASLRKNPPKSLKMRDYVLH
ncbi:hypothetical protein AAVH_20160 [Aphelenchoides avenae]|nr:hypothetical protein AAVH_20160 [Aphelenchus avenae]